MQVVKKKFSELNSFIDCTFELTSQCNYKCIHCYNSNIVFKELNFKEIEVVMHRIKELGVIELFLTGGEIFLRKDINEILDLSYSLGFKTTLYSNGSCITRELAQKIKNYDMRIEISIYGSNPRTYKCITGSENNYYKTVDSLNILKKLKVKFKTKSIIFNQNYNDFYEICDMIRYYNDYQDIDNAYDEISCFLFGDKDRMQKFRLNDEKIVSILKNSKQYKIISPKYGYCTALKTQLSIDPNGNVNPCIGWRSVIATNMLRDNWKEELNSFSNKFREDLKTTAIKCNTCDLFEYCIVCPMSFYQDTGTHMIHSNESCKFAKIRKYLEKSKGR